MKLHTNIAWIGGLGCLLALSSGVAFGQAKAATPAPSPNLFRLWSDSAGDTHVEKIKLSDKKLAKIPGATVDFHLGGIPPEAATKLHPAPGHMFAVTISGKIDLVASDGSKAHLEAGDIAYLDDTTGKGHTAKGDGSSISLAVDPGFDVKAWARGE
ncbi:MAG TPA: hypothetical protein VG821_03635 [Rhizomicrobium sp.]|nr:hypothetical protein [Rhizomicrobium sp.]